MVPPGQRAQLLERNIVAGGIEHQDRRPGQKVVNKPLGHHPAEMVHRICCFHAKHGQGLPQPPAAVSDQDQAGVIGQGNIFGQHSLGHLLRQIYAGQNCQQI
jgi:hypothetical protein